jgi:hypothetical protein
VEVSLIKYLKMDNEKELISVIKELTGSISDLSDCRR